MPRVAEKRRTTKETDVFVKFDLDGSGQAKIATGIGFLDHMLDLFAKHGLFDLEPRGRIEAKHERTHEMFLLNGLKEEYSRNGDSNLPNDNFLAEYCRLGGSRLAATA